MKTITQLNLFEVQELDDLGKILMELVSLPETNRFDKSEAKRKHGRKGCTTQFYFIAYIAKIILQLDIEQQLLRQLNMNSQLYQICGFETHGVKSKRCVESIIFNRVAREIVRSSRGYTRSVRQLIELMDD